MSKRHEFSGADADVLLIADEQGPLALAGIMGGAVQRGKRNHRDIFLEAAHFTPDAIIGRARRFGLSTDSSHRFERGVDSALPRRAIERATRLILDICGGECGPVQETGPGARPRSKRSSSGRRSGTPDSRF
jgi:phenylalanyl-tRNA synthetase beta chain